MSKTTSMILGAALLAARALAVAPADASEESSSGFAEYEAGGAMYLQIWETYGKAACEAKSAGCERMEEVL
jgi:hypothetical protein